MFQNVEISTFDFREVNMSKEARLEEAGEFYNLLDPTAGAIGVCPVRYYDGKFELKTLSTDAHEFSTIEEAVKAVGVVFDVKTYSSVNVLMRAAELKERGIKDRSICNAQTSYLRAFFIDLDMMHSAPKSDELDAKRLQMIRKIVPEVMKRWGSSVSVINSTGRGLGIYFVHEFVSTSNEELKTNHKAIYIEIERLFTEMLTELGYAVGKDGDVEVDKNVKSLHRVSKVPGSLNQGDNTRCTLLYINHDTKHQSVSDICAVFGIDVASLKDKNIKPTRKKTANTEKKAKKAATQEAPICGDSETSALPSGCSIVKIDAQIYKRSLKKTWYNSFMIRQHELARSIFETKEWHEGDGREVMLFLLYNTAVVEYGPEEAFNIMSSYNDRMAEPVSKDRLDTIRDGVDAVGYYAYKDESFIERLGVSKAEAYKAGLFIREQEDEQIAKNREVNAARDRAIAELYFDERGLSCNAISKLLKAEHPEYKCSRNTVINAIARLRLDTCNTIDEVDFDNNCIYKSYKPREAAGGCQTFRYVHASCSLLPPSFGTEAENVNTSTAKDSNAIDAKAVNLVGLLADNDTNRNAFVDQIANDGRNGLVIGAAGTGKSSMLRTIIRNKKALVLAPNGAQAERVNGKTVHNAFGLNPEHIYLPDEEIKDTEIAVLKDIEIVCIDEIGSLRRDIFAHVVAVIRKAKSVYSKNIQLVLFGDYSQCAPIYSVEELTLLQKSYQHWDKGYIYEDYELFKELDPVGIHLTRIFRTDDQTFQNRITEIRNGDQKALEYFNARVQDVGLSEEYLHICTTNKLVKGINEALMDKHLSDANTIRKSYPYKNINHWVSDAKDSEAVFFIGERVMTTVNTPSYVNGSLGTITKLNARSVSVRLDNGETVSVTYMIDKQTQVEYIPLVPAYAITVHKAQGATLDKVCVHGHCFCAGQLYVALSRTKTIDGLVLANKINASDLIVDETWKKAYTFEEEIAA